MIVMDVNAKRNEFEKVASLLKKLHQILSFPLYILAADGRMSGLDWRRKN